MLQALVRLEALLRDDLGVAHVAVFWIAELLIVFVVGLVSLSGQELLTMRVLHFDEVFIVVRGMVLCWRRETSHETKLETESNQRFLGFCLDFIFA